MRTRVYDGPFRYIIIDFVGPMTESSRGYKYMFTAVCAWSGWYWAIPTVDNDALTAAQCIFERVICDIAGYPTCIGSDRGNAFIESIVKSLCEYFGIKQVIGTAYHPQAQAAVERPHREYKQICRTFMKKTTDWDIQAAIFQWTIRTTSRLFNANYSPYEVITGLKPRLPTDAMFSGSQEPERLSTEEYVNDLVKYLKHVHQHVNQQHREIAEQRQEAKYRELGPGSGIAGGD